MLDILLFADCLSRPFADHSLLCNSHLPTVHCSNARNWPQVSVKYRHIIIHIHIVSVKTTVHCLYLKWIKTQIYNVGLTAILKHSSQLIGYLYSINESEIQWAWHTAVNVTLSTRSLCLKYLGKNALYFLNLLMPFIELNMTISFSYNFGERSIDRSTDRSVWLVARFLLLIEKNSLTSYFIKLCNSRTHHRQSDNNRDELKKGRDEKPIGWLSKRWRI